MRRISAPSEGLGDRPPTSRTELPGNLLRKWGTGNTHVNAVRTDATFRTLGQATVKPTGMLHQSGDYIQFADATLAIELAGTNFASGLGDYDRLSVTGNVTLDGTLDVSLIGGFSPAAGNVFDVLDFAALSGQFGGINLPTLHSGLAWNTASLYVDGTLRVVTSDRTVPEPAGLGLILLTSTTLLRRRSNDKVRSTVSDRHGPSPSSAGGTGRRVLVACSDRAR